MDRIKKHYTYIKTILLFGIKEKPQIWQSVILSLVGSVIEILSMAMLYPLTLAAQGQTVSENSKFYFLIKFIGSDGKTLLLLFLFLLLIRFIVSLSYQAITLSLGRDLLAIISSKIFNNVVKNIPISEITKNGIGYYTSISGDEAFRASMTIINLSQFLNLFILTLLYYTTMALFSIKLFVVITIFLLLCFVVMFTFFKKIQNLGIVQAEQSRETGLMFIDTLNNVKSIRCYSGEEFVTNNFSQRITNYTRILFWVDFYQVLLKVVPIILLIFIGMIATQVIFNEGGKLDLVFCISLLAYLTRFFPSLGQCVNILIRLIGDSRSGKDVLSLIDLKLQDNKVNPTKALQNIDKIELKKVEFSFDEKSILNNFNYTFSKGNKYGIIGPSGVGKSTLIDLILNFYTPSKGDIFINHTSVDEIPPTSLRSKIILMEQRVTIFQTTIFQNIALGTDYTLDEVRAACKLVRMDDFIESLPHKYETTIQYMGANLSGGQRQRIAMARAILRNPEALVLDESLSALDSNTKKEIFNDLCNIFKEKILIIIAHDDWIIDQLNNVIDFKNLENYKQEL